jgi:Inner membrane component of T3SS, cytoplasmic domain
MLELRILSGLHRGAAFPLDGDTISLGSSPDNDLVLCDPGMPAQAGTFSRGVDDVWSFRAGGTGKAACPVLVGAGTHLAIGPACAAIADELAPWDPGPTSPSPAASGGWRAALRTSTAELACVAACAALLLGAALLWLGSMRNARPIDAAGNAPAASRTVRPVEASVYPPPVTVARAPLDLASVRHGRHGFVVTREGQVLAPGYRWRDYTLQRIEPHKIVFSGTGVAELAW